ncbi:MAG: transferase hexapeptide repeat family protein [Rhodospirillaceae bacterium]|nr:transferase hexapeptide repeat family protein [Rhodospirillaceae bacterium]MBT5459927.1 transferase hexapeptide repeat family protein [Rhodospirillaceae bacterium]
MSMENIYSIDGIVPVVDPTAFVHPTATLIGDVIVGPRCYVGPNVSLRGDMGRIFMKPGSNMQDGCIAHTFAGGEVVLEEGANVGHGAVLHGCLLGKYVLIGMNAVIMDGAEIGDFSFVGALAMVKANFSVPPRSIAVGVPARILRELKEEEITWKRGGDEDYQSLIRRCQATMQRVEPLVKLDNMGEARIKIDGVPALYKTRK